MKYNQISIYELTYLYEQDMLIFCINAFYSPYKTETIL